MLFTLPSFAKVNLYLEILGKRDDDFHEIETVFQTVSLCDEITFEIIDDGIQLLSDTSDVPAASRNLIVHSANALQSISGVKAGARISLKKRIPVGGGLGGGSSNAAVTLIGLSRLWNLRIPQEELNSIAIGLGSDVPYFLRGGTALGTGRGERIEPLDDMKAEFIIIVTVNVHISSADAYARLKAPNLTNEASNRILNVSRTAEMLDGELKNAFEATVFASHPEIGQAKRKLIDIGAGKALMSGSGASVFGIFDNEETRQTALKALGQETDWRSFAVAAVSRREYREKLGI